MDKLQWLRDEINSLKEQGLYNTIRTMSSPQGATLVVDESPGPHQPGRHDAETDDAEGTVTQAAMPAQVVHGAADSGDDVDVGRVRGEDEGGGGAAARP